MLSLKRAEAILLENKTMIMDINKHETRTMLAIE